MKKFRITSIVLSVLLFSAWGCDAIFEDVAPSTAIGARVALESEDGVRAIRISMYEKIYTSFDATTEMLVGASAFSDESCNRPGATRFQGLCESEDIAAQTAHIGPFGFYEVIQDANLLINGIPDGVLDAADLAQFRGEALAVRAWAYHNMVRAYGYEPGNFSQGPVANWDAGVMLRVNATLDLAEAEPVARATVNEVYTQILQDLDDAIGLLTANTSMASAKNFATREFALAMRARVKLYQGDWAGAAADAATAITAANAAGVSLVTGAGHATMWYQPNPEALFELRVNGNLEQVAGSNVNNGLAAYTSDQWVSQVPTNILMDKYDPADLRYLNWYGDCLANQTVGAAATGCNAINDEGFSALKWNGFRNNFADDIPFFRISELYLIQAEAAAKATNIAAGVGPLNTLRAARGLAPVAAGDFANITAFEDEILDERSREFAFEGHRFFDLKRLQRDVVYAGNDPSRSPIKFPAGSSRMLAPFGTNYQAVNPLFVENPGYPTLQ